MNKIPHYFGFYLLIFVFLSCAHLREVKQAYSIKEYKKAFQLSEQAVLKDSTDVEAWFYLAKSSVALNLTDRGIDALKTINHLDPKLKKYRRDLSVIYQQLAEKALEKGENQNSMQYFLLAESLAPGNIKLLIRTAEAAFNAGYLNIAKLRYEKIIDLFKDPSIYIQRLNNIESRIQFAQNEFEKGMEAYKDDHFKEAYVHFESASKTQSENDESKYFYCLSKGKYLSQLGSGKAYLEAIEFFKSAGQLKPQQAESYYYIGRAYEMLSQHKTLREAVASYNQALKLDPNGQYALYCKKKIETLNERIKRLDSFWNGGK